MLKILKHIVRTKQPGGLATNGNRSGDLRQREKHVRISVGLATDGNRSGDLRQKRLHQLAMHNLCFAQEEK